MVNRSDRLPPGFHARQVPANDLNSPLQTPLIQYLNSKSVILNSYNLRISTVASNWWESVAEIEARLFNATKRKFLPPYGLALIW